MGFFTENVIPGNHGIVFTTNAKEKDDYAAIIDVLNRVDGIKDGVINNDIYPHEITVHTTKLVNIHDIQDAVRSTGFHLIPKTFFGLNR